MSLYAMTILVLLLIVLGLLIIVGLLSELLPVFAAFGAAVTIYNIRGYGKRDR